MTVWNVSIQKLLYVCHASFLIRHKTPLIRGSFEAWEFGPVCRPVYDALKSHGRRPVCDLISEPDLFTDEIRRFEPPSDFKVQDQIAEVMRTLGRLPPHQLIRMTHVPGGAWSEVWNKAKTGATLGNRIEDSLTIERFFKLKIAIGSDLGRGDTLEAEPFAGD